MKYIEIKTQDELDALPNEFSEYTVIQIKSTERVIVRKARGNSSVVARGNSSVEARGNSSVEARENSSVEARENSSVEARGNSSVEARENSSVEARGNSSVEARGNSSVEARGNSSVAAWGNSSVEARGNSSVEAWGNSSVVAWGNSSVEAWGNSSVEAWGNSSVVAWGNSSVEAWENSSVVAWENSSVVAWGNCCVRAQSDFASIILFAFAVCYALSKAKIQQKAKTTTVIHPKPSVGVDGWLESQGIKSGKSVVLFKRVSADFKTQEDTCNETLWAVGTTLEHHAWNPTEEECGAGKFHFCSRPYFCDEFRNKKDDVYIALRLKISDLYAWENAHYPHKIAGRAAKVLYVCDKFGKEIK